MKTFTCLFLFLFFLVSVPSTEAVTDTDIGIKLVLTQPGLGELLLIVDQQLTAIAEANEPIIIPALPPYSDDNIELLLTDIKINHTSHSSLAPITLPNKGLEAQMKGLALNISFTMDYNITEGRRVISGQDNIDMYINETTVTGILNITAQEDGNPLILVTPNITIDIGNLVVVDYGTLENYEDLLQKAFLSVFENDLPVVLTTTANSLLYNFTSSLNLRQISLTPGVAIDLSLPNNPTTTESLTLVTDLRGFAYFIPEGHCPSKMTTGIPPYNSFSSRMLQFAISDQVVNCLSSALFDSHQLNLLVNGFFQKFIDGIYEGPMQKGLELKLNCTLPFTVTTSSKTGVTLHIPSQMTWSRSPPISPQKEEYVALSTNLTVSFWPFVDNDFLKINLTTLQISLGTAYVSPNMPEKYLKQVESTNWLQLNYVLNAVLTNLVDFINEQIKDGFHIPEIPSEILTFGLGTIEVYDGYIVVATSFVGKNK